MPMSFVVYWLGLLSPNTRSYASSTELTGCNSGSIEESVAFMRRFVTRRIHVDRLDNGSDSIFTVGA